jgi:hypothetical protein
LSQNGPAYLKEKLKDQVTVYVNMDTDINIGVASGHSFRKDSITKMKYEDFLQKMNENTLGVALKDSSAINDYLKDDISNPEFMKEIANFSGIELIQG